uniref:hypothetical protein n=1 Tax=Agrobacterium fabrum TaxID=1176649 RepID=UPI0028FC1B32|nr:hypothetical protein [Agrobacterium fabrum]
MAGDQECAQVALGMIVNGYSIRRFDPETRPAAQDVQIERAGKILRPGWPARR